MKNAISNGALVAMAAGAMLLSSCGDKDLYNSNYKYEEYAANWESRFGQIDPNQDWSMATTVTATVNVGREGTFSVKVYSSDPSDDTQQAYLLGKAVVEGGSPVTLTFDAAKNLDNVYVALITEQNLGIIKKVAIENGNVNADFFITGAAKAKTRSKEESSWEKTTDYAEFTEAEIREIVTILPENVDASDKFNNYEFESTGSLIIYPVYGATGAHDKVGYYYYNPKEGETIDDRTECEFLDNWNDKLGILYNGDEVYKQLGWSEFEDSYSNPWTWGGFQSIRSYGYKLNIPKGCRVGFWIKNYNYSNKFYSNKILNEDLGYYSAVAKHSNGNWFFGLEDWRIADTDNSGGKYTDCNDIVFFVKSANDMKLPDPVDPNETSDSEDVPMSWLLACEDLGSTDDYDFNDIVVEVSKVYVQDEYKLIVKCLAAGGTLPAYIKYNGTKIGESHAMLGEENNTSQMINTIKITHTPNEYVIDKNIDKDIDENWTLTENVDKFCIEVVQDEGEQSSVRITSPEKGKAPQMIVVPGKWRWPKERIRIEEAYPKFTEWNSNATLSNWNGVIVDTKVIDR